MLIQLSIRDIVLIERLDLELDAGLIVLTGETGAGKSILLDAFALALGGRGDGALVRAGQAQGQVVAMFDPPLDHPARAAAAAAEIDIDGPLILRRTQFSDGRTRAHLNDQPVSAQVLRQVAASLVEIHGQHDDRALIDPATHRALVDAFGGLASEKAAVRQAYGAWRAAEKALADHRVHVARIRAEGDYLRHAAAELAALKPEAGEEEALAARRQTMMNAEKIAADLSESLEMMTGQAAPGGVLASILRRLERRASQAPALVEPVVKAIDVALRACDEVESLLEQANRATDYDPRELETVEERLFALRAAARKYQVPVDDLPALAARFEAELAALDADETRLRALEGAQGQAEAAYFAAAKVLAGARAATAVQLDHAVQAELPPLKLERATFTTEIVPAEPSAEGTERVEFFVQTNPGTRPGPMVKVASGGELSRFMLALKVALADRGSAPSLVFDEIDSGVGGAVADAIGQRLARLSERVQVLCVTHAPQVAARAAMHLLIAKTPAADGSRVATDVTPLADAARREEIARMLAGETITQEARAAAERLIAAG